MARVVWLTDIHLNFVPPAEVDAFLQQVLDHEPDAVLISGDIAEARDVDGYLVRIAERLARPIYFVLGNHDFYFGSIRDVRARVAELSRAQPNLHYLTASTIFELTPRHGLVGHDGWADGRLGDYEHSYVMMNDYKLIAELAGVNPKQRWPLLMQLGDEAAEHIRRVLPQALDRFPQVVLVTHVPPFREACWHEGQTSNDEWLPHFACKAMGDAIVEIMSARRDRRLTVLCGHTHSPGECRPLDNVIVYTGGATYGAPRIERVLEFE